MYFFHSSFFFPVFRNWKGRLWGPWGSRLREADWQQLPPRGHTDIRVPGGLRAGGRARDHVSAEQPVVRQQARLCMWVLCWPGLLSLSCDCQAGGEGGKGAGAPRKGKHSEPLGSASLTKQSMGVLVHQLPCFAHGKANPCYGSISYITCSWDLSVSKNRPCTEEPCLLLELLKWEGLRHPQAMDLIALIMSNTETPVVSVGDISLWCPELPASS